MFGPPGLGEGGHRNFELDRSNRNGV